MDANLVEVFSSVQGEGAYVGCPIGSKRKRGGAAATEACSGDKEEKEEKEGEEEDEETEEEEKGEGEEEGEEKKEGKEALQEGAQSREGSRARARSSSCGCSWNMPSISPTSRPG